MPNKIKTNGIVVIFRLYFKAFFRAGKIIFFLGAQPGDKNFLQTNGVFLC
jgi:hypothetical protein